MKRILILISCLLLAGYALAQQSAPSLATYPDITTPQTNAGIALLSYKSVVEANLATTFQLEQNDSQAIASLQGQVVGLQAQLNATNAALSALQAQVKALGTPPPTSTTLSWTSVPDGPLNGLFQGVDFGTGFWQVLGGELAPIADGQPGRSLTFPKPVTITSFTASTTNLASPMIVVSSAAGSMTITFTSVGQDFAASPGWTVPVTSIAMSPSCSGCSALNLRVRQIVYQ